MCADMRAASRTGRPHRSALEFAIYIDMCTDRCMSRVSTCAWAWVWACVWTSIPKCSHKCARAWHVNTHILAVEHIYKHVPQTTASTGPSSYGTSSYGHRQPPALALHIQVLSVGELTLEAVKPGLLADI